MAHPSANAHVNPALAREAMLEAIRSGSAADRLKKVLIQKNTASIHTRVKVAAELSDIIYLICVSIIGFSILQFR